MCAEIVCFVFDMCGVCVCVCYCVVCVCELGVRLVCGACADLFVVREVP